MLSGRCISIDGAGSTTGSVNVRTRSQKVDIVFPQIFLTKVKSYKTMIFLKFHSNHLGSTSQRVRSVSLLHQRPSSLFVPRHFPPAPHSVRQFYRSR